MFIIKHLIKNYYNKQIGKVNIYINLDFLTVMYFEYVCACVCWCACVCIKNSHKQRHVYKMYKVSLIFDF